MGITLSSRSPAMAYADGGLWCSTFDEVGRRCWVNNVTGERTYQFIEGKPVNPTHPVASPYPVHVVSPFPVQQSPMPGPHTAPWAMPSPSYPSPSPLAAYSGGAALVPYHEGPMPYEGGAMPPPGYGIDAPPVTPTSNGGLRHRLCRMYLRPTNESSWMWNRNQN